MSSTRSIIKRDDGRGLLGSLALVLGGMGLLKFLAIMVDEGPARSPWGFLLVAVVPFLVGRALLGSRTRAGALVIAVFAALLAVVCVVAVVVGIEPYWPDYLVVFVGGPLALCALGVAVRVVGAARSARTFPAA
jgi:hypothetical protein